MNRPLSYLRYFAFAAILCAALLLTRCAPPDEPLLYGEWRAYPESGGETVELSAIFLQDHTGRMSVTGDAYGIGGSKGSVGTPFRWDYNGKRIELESDEMQVWSVARLSADSLVVAGFAFRYKQGITQLDTLIFEKKTE